MLGVLAEREARAREEMMSKVVSIFEALDDQKEKPGASPFPRERLRRERLTPAPISAARTRER